MKKLVALVVVAVLLGLFVYLCLPAEQRVDGQSKEQWIATMNGADGDGRSRAIRALGEIGRNEVLEIGLPYKLWLSAMEREARPDKYIAIRAVISTLGDTSLEVRRTALRELRLTWDVAPEAFPPDLSDLSHVELSGLCVALPMSSGPLDSTYEIEIKQRAGVLHPYYLQPDPHAEAMKKRLEGIEGFSAPMAPQPVPSR